MTKVLPSLFGLSSRDDIGQWLTCEGLTGEAVEIGVYDGANALQILSTWPGRLHLVDPWQTQFREVYCETHIDHIATEKLARERMLPFGERAVFHKMLSDEAAPLLPGPFVFCYLDGNHAREQVERDIENWWPKVQPGGLLCGHDYFESIVDGVGGHCADIAPIVKAFAAKHGLALHITRADFPMSWWIQKPV